MKTTVSVMGLTEILQPYLDTLEYETDNEKTFRENISTVKQICNTALQEATMFYTRL
jgi:hypothetical protein